MTLDLHKNRPVDNRNVLLGEKEEENVLYKLLTEKNCPNGAFTKSSENATVKISLLWQLQISNFV